MQAFLDSSTFTWIILPALIFLARICDMSLDTMRIITIGQGRKFVAAVIGFFEICIWLLVARQVIMHLPNIACFFAYAGGFATGNYVGMWIEERLTTSSQMVRIITQHDGESLIEAFKAKGYGVTSHPAQGAKGQVSVIYTVVNRDNVRDVVALIEAMTPRAFYMIEDVRRVNEGVFPVSKEHRFWKFLNR